MVKRLRMKYLVALSLAFAAFMAWEVLLPGLGSLTEGQVRVDTGDWRQTLFGIPYSHERLPERERCALLTVAKRPPAIPEEWMDDAQGLYGPDWWLAVAWVGVDPDIARRVLDALRTGLGPTTTTAWPMVKYGGSNMSLLWPSWDRKYDGMSTLVQPGWQTAIGVKEFLEQSRGSLTLRDYGPVPTASSPASGADSELVADLATAARQGNLASVTKLLAAGVDPNGLSGYGWLPLNEAILRGNTEIIAALLRSGADPNRLDGANWCALGLSALKGQAATVRLLLAQGARVGQANLTGNTPIDLAAMTGNEEVVHLLLRAGSTCTATGPGKWTPLHWAAGKGDEDVVAALIGGGANLDARDLLGMTALHWALQGGHSEASRLLVEKGAGTSVACEDGWTAIYFAVVYDPGLVPFLLDHGARVNVFDARGKTPLHIAALTGRDKVARLLLEAGANVNARDKEGRTPLGLAVHDQDVADLLRAAGGTE